MAKFDPIWKALTPREQARVIALLVERVDYDGKRGKVAVKAAIEKIFRRIHSPAEFSGLHDMTTLIRKDGQHAKLHQISTGQRAAYALSLFLAQNAQLRSAPQLILIDDPIAHVDDLNCLSFLDYLREVALSGDRQIVFSTANEKIASLFQRKFDFLGEENFKRHDMLRWLSDSQSSCRRWSQPTTLKPS